MYLLDIVVRDFHASEFGFNRQHQLNVVEEIGSEIVREVVSLVTNSRSTPSCFATRVQTSSMEKHSLNGSGVKLPMVMMKPPIRYAHATACKSMRP